MSQANLTPVRNHHLLATAIATTFALAAVTVTNNALAQSEAQVLPKVKVSESVPEDANGPVPGYVAKRTGTGTKTDTPLIETPQAISVVTAEQIRDTNAQNLQETLFYTAGVATGASANNPQISDTFFLRGFQADNQTGNFYRDGMRYQANISNGKQEPYGLERVEYLKGPASVLYGTAAPGGIINTVSKRPQALAARELNLEFGSFDRQQASTDLTGPIDAEGVWVYRLTALAREAETFIDFGRDDRVYVAPALTWNPSEALSLTLLSNYQKSKQSDPGVLPLNGTIAPNSNGEFPRDTYLGDPNSNRFDTEIYNTGYQLDYRLSDTLKLSTRLNRYDGKLDNEFVLLNNSSMLASAGGAIERIIARQARRHDDETTLLTTDSNAQLSITTGPFEHTLLVGADTTRTKYESVRFSGNYAPADVFNLAGTSVPPLALMRIQKDNRRQTGVYVQDQIRFDKLIGVIGGRRDFFQNEDITNTLTTASTIRDRENATTGRAGLVYLFDNGLAPYVSYSESFNPLNGQRDLNGNSFEPDEGEQYEVGLRYQPANSSLLLSASVYEITRSNVLTPDLSSLQAVAAGASVAAGEVESRGVELEARGSLGDLTLAGSYTYTDTEITDSNCCVVPVAGPQRFTIVSNVGTRFSGIPKNSAALLAQYSFGKLGLPDLDAGVGVRYASRKPGNTLTDASIEVPSFTITDARLGYRMGAWNYTVNVFNLTDKKYIPSNCVLGVRGCAYGEPRKATASVSFAW
jgi:iron complex outermembrane recepter protein